jgi:hypothetical protein
MMSEEETLKSIHKALISFDKRAERSTEAILVATFVDSEPLFDLLATKNNQVIHGRRGTGKTHALKFLAEKVAGTGDLPIYLDLRSAGSNGSIYNDSSRSLAERATTLILDVLGALRDELFRIAVQNIDTAANPEEITIRVDDFSNAISQVKIEGSVQQATRELETMSKKRGGALSLELPSQTLKAKVDASSDAQHVLESNVSQSGKEIVHLNFGNILTSLTGLLEVLGTARVWLLVDEWSEIPIELQPYLADLVRRTILPVASITVKIAAIEHRSHFTILKGRGEYIGIELGADMGADLNLDDFLVFENNQEKATAFFANLIFKHYATTKDPVPEIDTADKLIQATFTQWPVFEEFVRAVEGVPRDALNLAAKMATKAFGKKISVQNVRAAARDWYQQDKASVVRGSPDLSVLLEHIIDEVIGNRKARAFLFPSNDRDERIDQLFDARLLHILKKNISSHDEPGVRYDVYKIDYGCYVDLINTSKAPAGLFQADEDQPGTEATNNEETVDSYVQVPRDDYRSIRRAILRMSEVTSKSSQAS